MRVLAAIAIVTAGFAACSSYGDSPATPDTNDAAAESSTEDGPATPADAAIDADGGCTATFCDDFENGPIGATWDGVENNGGKLEAVSNSTKGGRAMQATIDAVDAGNGGRTAFLTKKLPAGKRLVCTFLLKPNVVVCGPTDFADFGIIMGTGLADGVSGYSMIMAIGASDIGGLREDVIFDDGGCSCPRRSISLPSWANGVWSAMRIDTDFQTVNVSRDDVIIYKGDFAQFTPDSLTLVLGLRSYGQVHFEMTYDDLVCNVTN